MNNKQYIADYIANFCMIYPQNGLVLGRLPGTRYVGQYYLGNALYNAQFLQAGSDEFYDIILKNVGHFNFQLVGREWSAIPLLVSLPLILKQTHDIHINSFMIKRKRKTYGLHNYIEGMPNNLPCLIVDDLCNSTDSFRFCRDVLTTENKQVLPYVFAVLNKFGLDQGAKWDKEDRYLKSGFTPLTIVNSDDVHAAKRNT